MTVGLANRVRFPVVLYRHIQATAVRALRGDAAAKAELTRQGVAWRICVSDPQTWAINEEGTDDRFLHSLEGLGLGYNRAAICSNTAMHFIVNSEHVAPLPVMVLAFLLADRVYLQSRDLGPGLGRYLDNLGWSFTTRPEERRRFFCLEDQGNGILLSINQALNGCRGRVVAESSGQKVVLEKKGDTILGRRFVGIKIQGTRITLTLPLQENWTQEASGSDPHEVPGSLPINWIVGQAQRILHE